MPDRPAGERSRRGRWGLTPLRIVLIYVLLGVLWVGLSDRAVLLLVPDRYISSWVDSIKGWMYILLTGLLLWVLIRRGVEEGRREQAARLRSEERLRTILDTEPECVKVVSADGVLRQLNRAGLAMVEAESAEQVVGQNVLRVIAPEFRDTYAGMLRRVAAGVPEENEFEIVGLRGTRRVMQSSNVPLYGPDGLVEGVLAVTRDITQRRKEEAAARTSEALVGMVTDALPVLLAYVDAQGRYQWVNRRYEDWLGLARERMIGRRIAEVMPPDLYGSLRGRIERALAGERMQFRNQWSQPGRGVADFDVLYLPRRGEKGEGLGFFVLTADVTERASAENALRASEARYRAVVEDQTELICRFKPDGVLTFVNDAYGRYFGRTVESLVGTNLFDLILDPVERERLNSLTATIRRESPVISLEAKWRMEDGEVRVRHWVDRGLFDERGELVEVQAVGRDITARVRADEALRQSEATTRALLDAVPDLLFRMDRWGKYLAYHAQRREDLAVAPEEFLGRTAREVLPAARAEQCMESLEAVFRTGEPQTYEYETDRGREKKYWEVRVAKCGEEEALLLVRDVSQRKRAELELRGSEERYRLLFESNLDAILLCDDAGRITAANDAACVLLGRDRGSIEGRLAPEALVTPEGPERVRREHAGLVAGSSASGEIELIRPGGERRVVEYAGRRVGADQNMTILRDVSERKEGQRRQEMMMAELDHRVKNNLAAVLALAEQSVRAAPSLRAFSPAFLGRVRAMSRMHSALAHGRWEGAGLRQLIRQSLEAYMSLAEGGADGRVVDRITVRGPEVVIPARAVSPLAMALHELATNAAKYGALSTAGGRVNVTWEVEGGGIEVRAARTSMARWLSVRWAEMGGPRVRAPERAGFGTELIRGAIAHELHGDVDLEFAQGGVCCRIRLPLDQEPAGAGARVASGAG